MKTKADRSKKDLNMLKDELQLVQTTLTNLQFLFESDYKDLNYLSNVIEDLRSLDHNNSHYSFEMTMFCIGLASQLNLIADNLKYMQELETDLANQKLKTLEFLDSEYGAVFGLASERLELKAQENLDRWAGFHRRFYTEFSLKYIQVIEEFILMRKMEIRNLTQGKRFFLKHLGIVLSILFFIYLSYSTRIDINNLFQTTCRFNFCTIQLKTKSIEIYNASEELPVNITFYQGKNQIKKCNLFREQACSISLEKDDTITVKSIWFPEHIERIIQGASLYIRTN